MTKPRVGNSYLSNIHQVSHGSPSYPSPQIRRSLSKSRDQNEVSHEMERETSSKTVHITTPEVSHEDENVVDAETAEFSHVQKQWSQRQMAKGSNDTSIKRDMNGASFKSTSTKFDDNLNNPRMNNHHLQVNYPLSNHKPGNLFLSQIYFLFHLALMLCLLRASGESIDGQLYLLIVPTVTDASKKAKSSFFPETMLYYFAYLLSTSVLFILLIRCCKTSIPGHKSVRNTEVLLGSISLGLIQLISIGLDFATCDYGHHHHFHHHDGHSRLTASSTLFMFIPIMEFIFIFLLMHFILTQARISSSSNTGTATSGAFSNLAISHLLTTQVVLWLANFDPHYGPCRGFTSDIESVTNTTSPSMQKLHYPFSGLLVPVTHHFQLMTIFILLSLWMNNNDYRLFRTLSGINDSLVNDFGYKYFKRTMSVKGFFCGILMMSASIIVSDPAGSSSVTPNAYKSSGNYYL